jgi:hypothetical protein
MDDEVHARAALLVEDTLGHVALLPGSTPGKPGHPDASRLASVLRVRARC